MKTKALKIGRDRRRPRSALGGLMYTSLAEGTEYYKHVDEVMADPAAWHGKKLQLHGYVVDKSIMRKPDTLDYRFQIQSNGQVVNATLHAASCPTRSRTEPRSCSRDGWARTASRSSPNGVMAKCPSKYERSAAKARRAGTAASRA